MQSSTIPVAKGKKLKGIIKANYRLALELANTKEVISVQKQPSFEEKCGLKAWVKNAVKSKVVAKI